MLKQPNPTFMHIREMILKIPRGKVSTYGAVAAAAGYPRGARLTVRALSHAHGLPWHRVVAAGGRIATPGEHALDQRFRLEMEGVKFSGRKVRMAEFEHQFVRKTKKTTKKTAKKSITTGKKSALHKKTRK
jgi:alkylated DNA nucleotide flippase Atl1